MPRFITLLLVVAPLTCLIAQDTVYVKSVKNYQPGKVNYLKSPSGQKIFFTVEDEANWQDPEIESNATTPMSTGNMGPVALELASKSYVNPDLTPIQKEKIKANECQNLKFAGLSRSGVKTSIVSGNNKTYTSLKSFTNTLPNDNDMQMVVNFLGVDAWKLRSVQEQKTVTLSNVYLIAYKREEDNDYHLILSDAAQTLFFNAEISGLPISSADSYSTLQKLRKSFDQWPGARACGSYTFLQTPLKIKKLKGSLFFDTDHKGGIVGPVGFRPKSAWEIHPVTTLQFE